MSNYIKKIINPGTGKIEEAVVIDNYFNVHRYVQFPSGEVLKEDELFTDEEVELMKSIWPEKYKEL